VADDTPVNADELRAELWRTIVSAVMNSREEWRRAVIAATGLPFSRIRILRRVAREPLTLTELARAATVDAPAASVAVSESTCASRRQVSTSSILLPPFLIRPRRHSRTQRWTSCW
jgi:hypothetical protein